MSSDDDKETLELFRRAADYVSNRLDATELYDNGELSPARLLRLYGLFRQAVDGDAPSAAGSSASNASNAKRHAWERQRHKPPSEAMVEYIAIAAKLGFDEEAESRSGVVRSGEL